MKLIITDPAKKELLRLDKITQQKIIKAIERFAQRDTVNIKKIKTKKDLWRIAVGQWRIIYKINKEEALFYINSIIHRKDAYRKK